jgi:signal peptidase I
MRKFLASLLEVGEIALIALGAVFIVRHFLVQPFLVSGASMAPNFHNGDYLMVDELTYRVRDPERGEVVVFRYPNDRSTFYIKRIIGLPGERIVLADGKITINGEKISETYLPNGMSTQGSADMVLGSGEYFVMGDNRPYSFDSRTWGVLPREDIIGIARMRLWPVQNFAVLEAPAY